MTLKSSCPGFEASLYADDFAPCIWGTFLPCLEQRLQMCISGVQMGRGEPQKLFPMKSVCTKFYQLRGMFPAPPISVDGCLKYSRKLNFLRKGLGSPSTTDRPSFPISNLYALCQKAMNFLRAVGNRHLDEQRNAKNIWTSMNNEYRD